MVTNPAAAFWKVQHEFDHLWAVVFLLRRNHRGVVALRIPDLAICGEMVLDDGRSGAANIVATCAWSSLCSLLL
jgi:hypothetical protein